MKKVEINRNLKIILVIISIVLIVIMSFLLYKGIKNPGVKEENVTLYKYNNKANINYEVFLKPNMLYEDKSVGEGNLYITDFVDYINTNFNYVFNGERVADLNGTYEIKAIIEGYTGEGETHKTIWKKGFVLFPKTNFDNKNKNFFIKENIALNFKEYNDYAKSVVKTLNIGSSTRLIITMNINIKVDTDKGSIGEELSPSIEIPLRESYFEIDGELSQGKEGNIEETIKTQLPINKKNIVSYSVMIGLFSIILLFLLIFTKGTVVTDALQLELNKIFKKYGDRLVALNNDIDTYDNTYNVKSIEDLIRIADEIGKPILYKYSKDFKNITCFYVFDESMMYKLNLSETLDESNEEQNIINKIEKMIEKETEKQI